MNEVLEVIESHEAHVVDTMALRNALVFFVIVIAVILVCKTQNVFGTKSEKKLKKDRKQYFNEQKSKANQIKRLRTYREFAKKFGGPISESAIYQWDFRIQRLFEPIPAVGRLITATELIGLMRMIQFVACAVGFGGLVLNGSFIFLLLILLGAFLQLIVQAFCDLQIREQDNNIDRDFAEVYLLIHSKLLKGTDAHILSTLVDYLRICDNTLQPTEYKDLRKFVQDLVTTINVVTDETTAVLKIREKYKSATIVNFCNLAVQALRGIDNTERLMSFKLDLLQRTKLAAEQTARKRAEKAQYAIYAVWVILFEVVAVALVTRLFVVF